MAIVLFPSYRARNKESKKEWNPEVEMIVHFDDM
jgi:hypothetical protein